MENTFNVYINRCGVRDCIIEKCWSLYKGIIVFVIIIVILKRHFMLFLNELDSTIIFLLRDTVVG